MNKRIFISAASFRAPTVQNFSDLQRLMSGSFESEPSFFSLDSERQVEVHSLKLVEKSPFYPALKDAKVMREDVIAATICGQEILEVAQIEKSLRNQLPLYMSNGVCMDQLLKNINEISGTYASKVLDQDLAAKHKRVEKVTPPLFVLNVLTNASGSFISQYSGAKGDNTVYGNTSHSTIDALEEGMRAISSGKAELALVGAANGAGLFFALTFQNMASLSQGPWRLSNGAVLLLLETEESLKASHRIPLAEISSLLKTKKAPKLFSSELSSYEDFSPQATRVCYSGGLGQRDFEFEKSVLEKKWESNFSFYPTLGCMGVSSPFMNVLAACTFLNNGEASVDCLNRDPYGRESLLSLRRAPCL